MILKVLTGHCAIGIYAVKLNIIPDDSLSISCLEEDEINSKKKLNTFSSIVPLLPEQFRSHTFTHSGEIANIEIKHLSRFLNRFRSFLPLADIQVLEFFVWHHKGLYTTV